MERADLQAFLERGLSLEQIAKRVGKDASTVGYWVHKHGLRAVNHGKSAPRGGIDRTELEALTNAGASTREIAAALNRSQSTVRHWLARYELRTLRARQRADADRGPVSLRVCRTHGQTEFVLEGRGYYRCRRCRIERASEQRRRDKRRLIEAFGSRCVLCGYDRYVGALEFHHLDPGAKSFEISRAAGRRASATLIDEAAKCLLLCSNCHAEVEARVRRVPGVPAPKSSSVDDPGGLPATSEGRWAERTTEADRSVATVRCPRHGVAPAYHDGVRARCKRCRAEGVVRWRRRLKKRLVAEAGGRCRRCGYDRFQGALEFHHTDPESKRFALGAEGVARAYAKARAEALSCLLLCSNCHAEVEGGLQSGSSAA